LKVFGRIKEGGMKGGGGREERGKLPEIQNTAASLGAKHQLQVALQ
jgi:hypothetical protein